MLHKCLVQPITRRQVEAARYRGGLKIVGPWSGTRDRQDRGCVDEPGSLSPNQPGDLEGRGVQLDKMAAVTQDVDAAALFGFLLQSLLDFLSVTFCPEAEK